MDRIVKKKAAYLRLVAMVCVIGLLWPWAALAGNEPYGGTGQNMPMVSLEKYEKIKDAEKEAVENKLTGEPPAEPGKGNEDNSGIPTELEKGEEPTPAGPTVISSEDYEALKALKACKEIEILPDEYKDINSEGYENINFAYLVSEDGSLVGMKISGAEVTIYLNCMSASRENIASIIGYLTANIMDENKEDDAAEESYGENLEDGALPLRALTTDNGNGSGRVPNGHGQNRPVIALGGDSEEDNFSKTDKTDNQSSDRLVNNDKITPDTDVIKKDVAKLLKAQESAAKNFYEDAGPYYSKLESILKKAHWLWERQGIDPHLYYAGADGVVDEREIRRMVEESVTYVYENIPSDVEAQRQRENILGLEKALRSEYIEPALESYKREIKAASREFYKSVEELIRPAINPFVNKANGATEVIISLPTESLN